MESGFYLIYLVFIMGTGIYLIAKTKGNKVYLYFGLAALILGFGDAFHLVPRAVGLFSGTLDEPSKNLALFLGIGKLITSITMTIFYGLIHLFIYKRSDAPRTMQIDVIVNTLIITRFILCAFPQNEWATNGSNLTWGIIRNIPFVLLGIIVIVISFKHFKGIKHFKLLWLAITLSFAFYLSVVLFVSTTKWVGMLMLPKTICYMWIGLMALLDFKANKNVDEKTK